MARAPTIPVTINPANPHIIIPLSYGGITAPMTMQATPAAIIQGSNFRSGKGSGGAGGKGSTAVKPAWSAPLYLFSGVLNLSRLGLEEDQAVTIGGGCLVYGRPGRVPQFLAFLLKVPEKQLIDDINELFIVGRNGD